MDYGVPTEDFYALQGIRHLTAQEERYVLCRVQGLNPSAAARAAGFTNPIQIVAEFSERDDIKEAIAYGREMSRQMAINAGALEFTKDDATLMYLDAHAKSATATEMIKATDSLVKLHGLATPEKVELEITRKDQIEQMDDEKLLEMAGSLIDLDPEDYVEVESET